MVDENLVKRVENNQQPPSKEWEDLLRLYMRVNANSKFKTAFRNNKILGEKSGVYPGFMTTFKLSMSSSNYLFESIRMNFQIIH